MAPAPRQKPARALRRFSPLRHNPTFSNGVPQCLGAPTPICGTTRATRHQIKDDIKRTLASPYYAIDEAAAITEFVRAVHQPVFAPCFNTVPFVSTRGGETSLVLDNGDDLEVFVKRLMDVVSEALVPVAPLAAATRLPEVFSYSPTQPPPPPPPPPAARLSESGSLQPVVFFPSSSSFTSYTSTSSSLVPEAPPTHPPLVPRKSGWTRARASAGNKIRLPLGTHDSNICREVTVVAAASAAAGKVKEIKLLRGAGNIIFISRAGYRSAPAVPRAVVV